MAAIYLAMSFVTWVYVTLRDFYCDVPRWIKTELQQLRNFHERDRFQESGRD